MGLENGTSTGHKVESRYRLYTLHKINSKWTTGLNVKCKTIKPLADPIGENLDDLGYDNNFLDTSKTQSMDKIIDSWTSLTLKT